jgi:hypothetical protein
VAEHTPGPWEISGDEEGWTIRMGTALADDGRWQVQHRIELDWGDTYDGEGDNSQYEEAEANARLIAAAPDLLAALEGVTAYIEDHRGDGGDGIMCTGCRLWKQARAAIARARGEANNAVAD